MIIVQSAAIKHERKDLGYFSEPYRKNPNKSISFFIHDGNNLHIVRGMSGDSHSSVGFPYLENALCYGRLDILTNKLAASLDPDLITLEIFEKIVLDIIEEYGEVTARWEYYGEWYTTKNLIEEQFEQKY